MFRIVRLYILNRSVLILFPHEMHQIWHLQVPRSIEALYSYTGKSRMSFVQAGGGRGHRALDKRTSRGR
jgi:hypothetical protein